MPFKNAELLTEMCCRETKLVFPRKLLGFDEKKNKPLGGNAKAPGNELICAIWDRNQVTSLLLNLLIRTF